MSKVDLKSNPDWVWWTLIPVVGGLIIAYVGNKHKLKNWVNIGWGVSTSSMVLLLGLGVQTSIICLSAAIGLSAAMYLKREYLIKISPRDAIAITDRQTSTLVAQIKGKIDINKCSKDELVRGLGLPIVYANDIETVRTAGHIFTHIEELTDLIGIPQSKCDIIEPSIAFNYYDDASYYSNWQRLNLLPSSELVELGIGFDTANAIVSERQRAGNYRSLVDIQRRTGLPINLYKHLI
jgi:DNA uptake protein ComE-like DNA-binding protein